MARSRTQPDEREVVVPEGSNAVTVRVRDHDWVALLQDGAELLREQSGNRETTFVAEPGTYRLSSDGRIDEAEATSLAFPSDPLAAAGAMLRLSSDAPDRHVVDGVGEIAADGKSFATITVEKVDAAGEPLHHRGDDDEVFLRATGGTITDAKKSVRVRSVKLKAGRATFRLVSEAFPRLVTVSALGAATPVPAELQIEFV